MGERTGLGLLDELVVRSLADVGAAPSRPHVKSTLVLRHADRAFGLAPGPAFAALAGLTRPWNVNLVLVDGHGNFGSPGWPPAAARYTEARLTDAGALAVASEAGELPRLPIGLVNGDVHLGGTRPPFAPDRVADALEAAIGGGTDDEVLATLGRPTFPTGCAVEVHGTRLRCSARLAVEGERVVLSALPPGATPQLVGEALASRAGLGSLDLRGVDDESTGEGTRIVVRLGGRSTPEDLLDVWPITTVLEAELPGAADVRRYVEGPPAAQLEALARLRRAAIR